MTSYDSCICLKVLPEPQKTQENVLRMRVVEPELVALEGDGGLKLSEKWFEGDLSPGERVRARSNTCKTGRNAATVFCPILRARLGSIRSCVALCQCSRKVQLRLSTT
jgi:hypothetical protein